MPICGGGDDKPAAAPGRTIGQAGRNAAGLPPEPSATARYAHLEALNKIDPRISKPGKEEQTVSRGTDQCGSIKTVKDRAELIKLTLSRFTIDTRLPDLNDKAGLRCPGPSSPSSAGGPDDCCGHV
ncbi:hypothetical protein OHA46_09030 [Streptomyces sp. NBC_00708]